MVECVWLAPPCVLARRVRIPPRSCSVAHDVDQDVVRGARGVQVRAAGEHDRLAGPDQPARDGRIDRVLPQILERLGLARSPAARPPSRARAAAALRDRARPRAPAAAAGSATPAGRSSPTGSAPRSRRRRDPRRCRTRRAPGSIPIVARGLAAGLVVGQRRLDRAHDPVHHRHRLERISARPRSRPRASRPTCRRARRWRRRRPRRGWARAGASSTRASGSR